MFIRDSTAFWTNINYYLLSYGKQNVEAYEDTEELKNEGFQEERDSIMKKVKSLLELKWT